MINRTITTTQIEAVALKGTEKIDEFYVTLKGSLTEEQAMKKLNTKKFKEKLNLEPLNYVAVENLKIETNTYSMPLDEFIQSATLITEDSEQDEAENQ